MPNSRQATRFEDTVLPHLDAAYNLARWLTRNHHDAEDVMQDAFLRAFRFFGGCRPGDARPWLLRIVRNAAYDWLRANRPAELCSLDEHGLEHGNGPGDDPDCVLDGRTAAPDDPETHAMKEAERRLVNRLIADLPVAYREVIVLRELNDLSYREIAGIAGVPMGTVMSRLSRARQMLQAAWDATNATEGPRGL
ncbi:sigma-70 family RNA polymerase sigma factor [Azospirillum canadense]|uniref:sigma-70 family RNA polymerase sigma factor n=1 Tax=Azospirillum canadense TaxID=403962 RepID=UPI002226079E|nr:sigma-70 family RNA polymerase sigma factor [Azospirillum canadense]MCW2237951.1 RNA polymerase sigma-70 factor (ECF subfamily) [Azospirillum canadense]